MFDFLINLPWLVQMSVIFGSVIAALLAVVAVHDLIVRVRHRIRVPVERRQS